MDKINRDKINKANIEAIKKANTKAVISFDNSANSNDKIIDQYANFVGFLFATFAATNCVGDFNFVIFKKTS